MGHIVHAADSVVCCGSIRNLEKIKFSEIFLILVFRLKNLFSKILYLEGSGSFVCTLPEI